MAQFNRSDRVQVHPAHDLWMRGMRYGTVIGVGKKYVSVLLDRDVKPFGNGRTQRFLPDDLIPIGENVHSDKGS
jgi:hypothetical protein